MTLRSGFPDYRGRDRYPLGVAPEAWGLVGVFVIIAALTVAISFYC